MAKSAASSGKNCVKTYTGLQSLLQNLEAGNVPHGTISRKHNRIPIIDENLRMIAEQLSEIPVPVVEQEAYTLKEYEEAVEPFNPLLKTLEIASTVVEYFKRGKIKVNGHTVELPRLWGKSTPPHIENIQKLRGRIYKTIEPIENRYKKWKKLNLEKRAEIESGIRTTAKLAEKAEKLCSDLDAAYGHLENYLKHVSTDSRLALKSRLHCGADVSSALIGLNVVERQAADLLLSAKREYISAAQKIISHYPFLTDADFGERPDKHTEGSGFLGELAGIKARIKKHMVSSGEETLFATGVTPKTEDNGRLIESLEVVQQLEPLLKEINNYRVRLESMKLKLDMYVEFPKSDSLEPGIDDTVEDAKELVSKLSNYPVIQRVFENNFVLLEYAQEGIQNGYRDACKSLREKAKNYLAPTFKIKSSDGLKNTREDILEVLTKINEASNFSFPGITPEEVIPFEHYDSLSQFYEKVKDASWEFGRMEYELRKASGKFTDALERIRDQNMDMEGTRGYRPSSILINQADTNLGEINSILRRLESLDPRIAPVFNSLVEKYKPGKGLVQEFNVFDSMRNSE